VDVTVSQPRQVEFRRLIQPIALRDLRRFAIARSLFGPSTLSGAFDRFRFVQADPIRAPARAQDLTLRHRVADYHAGDLDLQYQALDLEEDVFVNYGYVSRSLSALMHPRTASSRPPAPRSARERAIVAFLNERGEAHPREVDQQFSHGTVTNYWGRPSRATTHLLEEMQYRGLVRVVRRDHGIRIYAARQDGAVSETSAGRDARLDALVDVVVAKYAPLPLPSLAMVVGRLRYAVPQWRGALKQALHRARHRLAHARVDDIEWYWPVGESPQGDGPDQAVRLLTPFDPIVWDRRRFELLWGWRYRFEAYTPPSNRKLGYYALPMLWRDAIIGWANVTTRNRDIDVEAGYVATRPRNRTFSRELDAELDRLRTFLSDRGL